MMLYELHCCLWPKHQKWLLHIENISFPPFISRLIFPFAAPPKASLLTSPVTSQLCLLRLRSTSSPFLPISCHFPDVSRPPSLQDFAVTSLPPQRKLPGCSSNSTVPITSWSCFPLAHPSPPSHTHHLLASLISLPFTASSFYTAASNLVFPFKLNKRTNKQKNINRDSVRNAKLIHFQTRFLIQQHPFKLCSCSLQCSQTVTVPQEQFFHCHKQTLICPTHMTASFNFNPKAISSSHTVSLLLTGWRTDANKSLHRPTWGKHAGRITAQAYFHTVSTPQTWDRCGYQDKDGWTVSHQ